MRTLKLHTASVLIMLTFSSLLQAQYILSAGKSNGESRAATPKPIKPSSSKPTPNAGLIVEKKDTKFQEADAKRILQEKKAAAQRSVQKAAQKAPQFSPTQRKMIKLTGSSRQ